MSTDKVVVLPGSKLPTIGPNPDVVDLLSQLLARAESGEIQSFIGTGFTRDGLRLALWADTHHDVYQMLGAVAWLQAEYIHRHTDAPR